MTRALKKFKYTNHNFLKILEKNQVSTLHSLKKLKNEALKKNWFLNKELFITDNKSIIILDFMVGLYFLVYNGLTYQLVFIKENMIGYKIGEFVLTKTLGEEIHNLKKRKNKR